MAGLELSRPARPCFDSIHLFPSRQRRAIETFARINGGAAQRLAMKRDSTLYSLALFRFPRWRNAWNPCRFYFQKPR
jgi:hypothetical protein